MSTDHGSAWTPSAARCAELLHVLTLPDLECGERIGEYWSYPESRTFAELLIDAGRIGRSVFVGMLREADGSSRRSAPVVGQGENLRSIGERSSAQMALVPEKRHVIYVAGFSTRELLRQYLDVVSTGRYLLPSDPRSIRGASRS